MGQTCSSDWRDKKNFVRMPPGKLSLWTPKNYKNGRWMEMARGHVAVKRLGIKPGGSWRFTTRQQFYAEFSSHVLTQTSSRWIWKKCRICSLLAQDLYRVVSTAASYKADPSFKSIPQTGFTDRFHVVFLSPTEIWVQYNLDITASSNIVSCSLLVKPTIRNYKLGEIKSAVI